MIEMNLITAWRDNFHHVRKGRKADYVIYEQWLSI